MDAQIPAIHRTHNVLKISTRATIVRWMIAHVDEHGEKHLFSKTLKEFPQFFASKVQQKT